MFGGDLFSSMSKPKQLDVIDSWQDLAKRPNLKILTTLDFQSADVADGADVGVWQFATKSSYFSAKSPFYHEFTRRLKVESEYELQRKYTMPDGEVLGIY